MRPSRRGWGTAFLLGLIYLYLLAPIVLVVASSFSETKYLTFPPQGFTLAWYHEFWNSLAFRDAFGVSLKLALASTTVALLVGAAAAFALDRYRFPGRSAAQAALLSPLVLPLLVVGIALLQFLSRLGLARTFASLLMGHLVITIPYVVRTMLATLSGFDRNLEEAALNLGATPAKTLWYVTLPIVRNGILAAGIFAFIASFGNVSLSIFLAGGREATLPVRLFQFVEYSYDPTITAISTLIIVMTTVSIIVLDRMTGLERLT